jgi:hypothetical protein
MVELSDLKAALKIEPDQTAEDDYIVQLEAAAVAHVQTITGLFVGVTAAATVWATGNGLRDLWLPTTFSGVTTVLERTHPGAASVAVTDYVVRPGHLRRTGSGGYWPWDYEYEVTGNRGYAVGAEPADIRLAVTRLVTRWFEIRMPVVVGQSVSEVPGGVMELLAPYMPPVVA